MRSKEYLLQIYKLDKLIQAKLDEIQRLKSSAISSSMPVTEKVQSSPRGDRLEKTVAAYVDMEGELYQDLIDIQAQRREILDTMAMLPGIEYAIIYDLYVNYLPINIVEEKMDRSYSFVSKRHSRGLKRIQEILDERNERTKGGN